MYSKLNQNSNSAQPTLRIVHTSVKNHQKRCYNANNTEFFEWHRDGLNSLVDSLEHYFRYEDEASREDVLNHVKAFRELVDTMGKFGEYREEFNQLGRVINE